MKTLTVRLPNGVAAELDAESKRRRVSKSDLVRERLTASSQTSVRQALDSIADLIGSVDGLPADLSTRKKAYLKL